MAAVICPAILAADPDQYHAQMLRVMPFAKRIQIDLTDRHFAKTRTIDLSEVVIPKGIKADLHLMYKRPALRMKEIAALKPHLVIVHAEAKGNFVNFASTMHQLGIKVGVAVLPKTPLDNIKPALPIIDHLMIFSGNLGKFGGTADPSLLTKAQELKELKPSLEVGWDGGITDQNVHLLAAGGIDVLNVGGFIQKAKSPKAAYAKIKEQLG